MIKTGVLKLDKLDTWLNKVKDKVEIINIIPCEYLVTEEHQSLISVFVIYKAN